MVCQYQVKELQIAHIYHCQQMIHAVLIQHHLLFIFFMLENIEQGYYELNQVFLKVI